MSGSRRRFVFAAALLAFVVGGIGAFAPPARAEGVDAADHYDRRLMALADAAMPEGWKVVHDDRGADVRQAMADAIAETAKATNLDPRDAEPLLTTLELPEGKLATLVLVDAKTRSGEFASALKMRAATGKWTFRQMGSNRRLLLVSAPEDVAESVVALQTKFAAKMIADKAQAQLESHFEHVAQPLAEAAVAIEPGASLAHSVLGRILLEGIPSSPTPAQFEPAVSQLRMATAEQATVPLSDRDMAETRGTLGQLLLLQVLPAADLEARDVLKKAIAAEALLLRPVAAGNRYNLACAHGRLKEIEPAFEHLKVVLDWDAKTPVVGISHWRKDPDLDSLHADARWAEMAKKYPDRSPAAGN